MMRRGKGLKMFTKSFNFLMINFRHGLWQGSA